MKDKDINHLEWVYERMVFVHNENENFDYMIRFSEILKDLRQTPVSGSFHIDLNKEAHLIRSAEKYKHPLPSSFGGYRWHEYIKDAMEEYAQNYAIQVLKIHGLLGNDR